MAKPNTNPFRDLTDTELDSAMATSHAQLVSARKAIASVKREWQRRIAGKAIRAAKDALAAGKQQPLPPTQEAPIAASTPMRGNRK